MAHAKYKIRHSTRGNSYKIFADRSTQKLIAELLAGKNCSIEMRKSFKGKGLSFIELDNRALEILLDYEKELKLERSGLDFNANDRAKIREKANKEAIFAQELRKKNYDLNKRIWAEGSGPQQLYHTKIHGDIYSSANLDDLIALIKGDYLIEEKKDIMRFSLNPIMAFGIFSVAYDFLSSDKSVLHLYNGHRKFDYFPLIKDVDQFRVILDGADDAGNVFADADISHETLAMIEGLLLFPLFLKAVSTGYDSLRDETHDFATMYAQKPLKLAELKVKLEEFRKQLCEISGVNYEETLKDSPRQLMNKVAAQLAKIKSNSDLTPDEKNLKLNQIVELSARYNHYLTEHVEAPKEKAIYAAYAGWLSMVGMMGAIGAYEMQAIMNIAGGIEGISSGAEGEDVTLLSQIGATFGFGGQILMTAYALYRTKNEYQEWQKVKKELLEFKEAKNVSELARQVTQKLLSAESTYHKTQTFGHAALALGQSMMAITGPIGLKIEPLSYLGLAITLGSVAVNAVSELKYKRSYAIDHKRDEIETEILSRPPQFATQDLSDLNKAIFSHTQHQIFALEVLGHLRAPQFVLYEKFIERNKDDRGILDRSLALMGWGKFMRWLQTPPQTSIDMVQDNPQISALANENDIDVLSVDKSDLGFIWNISECLSQLHALKTSRDISAINKIIAEINSLRRQEYGNHIQDLVLQNYDIDQTHQKIIEVIQKDFVDKKVATRASTSVQHESTKEICKKIIERGGDGALYLKRKLLRCAANGELSYRSKAADIVEITKNGKKINIGKFDLDNFAEKDLEEFLVKRRKKKGITIIDPEKKSPLAKARDESRAGVMSEHLRPFREVGKFSSIVEKYFDDLAAEEENEERRLNELQETSAVNQPLALKPQDDPQTQSSLLQNLDQLAKEEKAADPHQRELQVEKQNAIIDELSKQQHFTLIDTIPRDSRTFFVYEDPHFPGSQDHQIIYDRDDKNGEITVYYGAKTQAILVQKSNMEVNAYAAQIELADVKEYGEKSSQTQYTLFQQITSQLRQKLQATPNTVTDLRDKTFRVREQSLMHETTL